jgi:hypothetical protein
LGLPFEGFVIFKDYVTYLEYIRSCEELWGKGLYVELQAYQHHVFMDWRFVEDPRWGEVHAALNGAGVESMQARWEEMFGVKEEETVETEEKVKKTRKKTTTRKTTAKKSSSKKKATSSKAVSPKKTTDKKRSTTKKSTTRKAEKSD